MNSTRRTFIGGTMASLCCGHSVARASEPVAPNDMKIICGLQHQPLIKHVKNMRDPHPDAKRVIHWVTDQIGVRPAFDIIEADFERQYIAIAATRGSTRYIIYDAKWFPFNKDAIGWYTIWVLAHEIGHHIHGHTIGFEPDSHRGELDADRFGGWVVARLGGRLEQALTFMPYLSKAAGKTHPSRVRRIEAAYQGWMAGNRLKR